jgi:hypothetical protein
MQKTFQFAGHTFAIKLADGVTESDYDEARAMFAETLAIGLDGVFHAMPTKSVEYLIGNGFSQTVRDKAAIGKDAATTEEKRTELKSGLATKRFDTLLTGNIGTRAFGPRLSVEEKERRAYIDGVLAAKFAEKKKPMAKGEALVALRDKYYAKYTADVDAAVAERLAKVAGSEIDLDELLA